MKRKIFISVAFLCIAFLVRAQHQTIQGVITNTQNEPIEFASIILINTDLGGVSDDKGNYKVEHVPYGNYRVKISSLGYETIEKEISISTASPARYDFILPEATIDLEGVTITAPAIIYAEKKTDAVARMPLKNLENPQVYTVLPKELMQAQVITDYQVALNSAPGLSNVNYTPGGGGISLSAYIRGFSTVAGTIRNGLSTNFVTLADPYNTERLEVIKGPSGTLFGSTLISYGGLINRQTKKPFNLRKGEIAYTLGSWNNNRITADINLPINDKVYTRFNGFYQDENTFQDYGKNKSIGFTPSFHISVNERLTFDIDAELYSTTRNPGFISIGRNVKIDKIQDLNLDPSISYASNEIQSRIDAFNIFVKATYQLSDNWESQTLISSANTKNGTNYFFLEVVGMDSIQRSYLHNPSSFNAIDIQQNFLGKFSIGSIKNNLLIGVDYSQNKALGKRTRFVAVDIVEKNKEPAYFSEYLYQDLLKKQKYSKMHRDLKTTSFYLSDVIHFTESLIAMASLRADFFDGIDYQGTYKQNTLSPKFGIVYQPIQNKVSLFANYMNGFKNVPPATTSSGKKPFKPEQANQFEIGLKAELFDKKVSGTVSYYNIAVKNIVRPNPDEPTESIQDGTQESTGFEMDLITNPFHGFELIFGYGYNQSKYVKAAKNVEGKRPYGVPKHVANFWGSYKISQGIAKGLGLGLGGNIQSEMMLNDATDIKVSGFYRLDASIFYDQPEYRLSCKMNNVTDQRYFLSNYWGQFQNPRQLLVNVIYKF